MRQSLFQVGIQIDSQVRNDSNIRTNKKNTNLVNEVKAICHVIVVVGQENTIHAIGSNIMIKLMTSVVGLQIKGTTEGININRITNVEVFRQAVIHRTQKMKRGIIEKVAKNIRKVPDVLNTMTLMAMMKENVQRRNLKKEKDLDQEDDDSFQSGNLS